MNLKSLKNLMEKHPLSPQSALIQKLSDKLKILELSHNRERKLLRMCQQFLEDFYFVAPSFSAEYLHKRITLELDGLENYKGLKGGKKCV